MKQLLFILCALSLTYTQAQTFTKTPGGATDVSISSSGDVYVIGVSKQIFKWDFAYKKWNLHAKANKSAKTLVALGHYVRYTDINNKLYKTKYLNYNFKEELKTKKRVKHFFIGLGMVNYSVAPDGSIVPSRIVRRKTLGPTTYNYGMDNEKICVTKEGYSYVLKKNKTIYVYHGNSKTKLPGAATDIAYDMMTDKIYVVGVSKRIFSWNTRSKKWNLVKNTRNDVKSIAVHNNEIWCTTTNNAIYSNGKLKKRSPSVARSNSNTRNNSSKNYKLKITLNWLFNESNRDFNGKGDHLLKFIPSLKLNGREQAMLHKKYQRIEKQIKHHGPQSALYVYRGKGKSDHAAVQLHVNEGDYIHINNSGVYEIPKNLRITDTNSHFTLDFAISEVSNDVLRIGNEKLAFNLKLMLDYLTAKKNINSFQRTNRVNWQKEIVNRSMGSGYRDMHLTQENGKRVIKDWIYNYKDNCMTFVHYTIELVD